MAFKLEGGKLRDDSIRYILNTASVAGVVATYSTGSGSSGVGESILNEVVIPGTGSTSGLVPAGVLVCEVVSIDETRYSLNEQKNQVRVGGPVHLLKKGEGYTDQVTGTPKLGDKAYLAPSGKVTPTPATGVPAVGTFGGRKDANGFVFLYVNIE